MSLVSTIVAPETLITAQQYNNMREDITDNHDHSGSPLGA